jgi:chitosanase
MTSPLRTTILATALALATAGAGLALAGPAGAATGTITNRTTGKCIGAAGGNTANGTAVDLYSCVGSATQQWTLSSDGTVKTAGKCLDVAAAGTANGTKVQLYDCNGTDAQKWYFTPAYDLVNVNADKCLDLTGNSTADFTKVQIWSCTGGSNQKWAAPSGLPSSTGTPGSVDLTDPWKKEVAMRLVSSAENSSLDWKAQYKYIEDIGDGRGYTGGIIGFCSGTGDMLELVQLYTTRKPGNVLAKYLPALQQVNGTDSHAGLDPYFTRDWATAATDPVFQQAQNDERDRVYFNPAVNQAKADGLRALGQFIYYDAIVMHGPGTDPVSFGGIRKTAMSKAKTPAQGGNETTYLNAFLDARKAAMLTEEAHSDTTRVDTEQRWFLNNGNLDLNTPLDWQVYGEPFHIS